jgi:hypothetical protein
LPLKKKVGFNNTHSNTEDKETVVTILDEDDVWYTPTVDYWIRALGLKLSDNNIALNNEWISNSHIKAANIISRKQFPDFNGLQDSELVPFFLDGEQIWQCDTLSTTAMQSSHSITPLHRQESK